MVGGACLIEVISHKPLSERAAHKVLKKFLRKEHDKPVEDQLAEDVLLQLQRVRDGLQEHTSGGSRKDRVDDVEEDVLPTKANGHPSEGGEDTRAGDGTKKKKGKMKRIDQVDEDAQSHQITTASGNLQGSVKVQLQAPPLENKRKKKKQRIE